MNGRRVRGGARPPRLGRVGLAIAFVVAGVVIGLVVGMVANPFALERDMTSAGYITYWDQEGGFEELAEHAEVFNEVSPWWYGIADDGSVIVQHVGVVDIDRTKVEELQADGKAVIPTVANHREGEWIDTVGEILADPMRQQGHIESLVDLVVTEEYEGVDIDYENLAAEDREHFSDFLRGLSRALHDEDKVLSVDVHAKTTDEGEDERNVAQDYAAIGRAADQVRLMTYDHHWSTSEPGPVAPIDWVVDVLDYASGQVPREKLILGIGAFGYDWVEGQEEAGELTVEQAEQLAADQGAEIQWDEASASPWFTYTDEDGREHTVWFENARSVEAKVALVDEYELGGAFVWRLGGNDDATLEAVRQIRE